MPISDLRQDGLPRREHVLDLYVFWKHYPGPDDGDECSKSVAQTDPRYCSEAGLNRYEPIIDKAMRSDLIPRFTSSRRRRTMCRR